MTETVLIVASHPDDEVLGAGATVARHAADGDEVHTLIVAEGATARPGAEHGAVSALRTAASSAARILGVRSMRFLGLADNRLDTIALLDVIQKIEAVIADVRPTIVYTHFIGDLNRDHAITAEATEVACRPLPGQTVQSIYAFETVSSTEWAPRDQFAPQLFVEVGAHIETKMQALKCYESEIRPFPHARSYEAVSALARLRGAQAGFVAAEAFMVRRQAKP